MMSSRAKAWGLPLGGAVALCAASVAVAASGQTYSQKFTVKHPGQTSGMTFSAGGPVQAKTVTLTFPAGTKINTAAVARCTKTPNCPKSSQIGTGTATVLVGTSVFHLPVAAYNRSGGMVLVVSNPAGSPVVLKPTLSGATLKLTIPKLDQAGITVKLRSLQLKVTPVGSASTPYVRTPSSCPKAGAWTFTGRFTYAKGKATTLKSRSACAKH